MANNNQMRIPASPWTKYNSFVSTAIMGIAFKVLLVANALTIKIVAVEDRMTAIETKTNNTNSEVSSVKMDFKEMGGSMRTMENKITRIEAILPPKQQFSVQPE